MADTDSYPKRVPVANPDTIGHPDVDTLLDTLCDACAKRNARDIRIAITIAFFVTFAIAATVIASF